MRLSSSILGTIALAGCALHPAPAPQPAPLPPGATISTSPEGQRVVTTHSTTTVVSSTATARGGDTAATVIPAGRPMDASRTALSGADVKRRALEVFGDSSALAGARPDSASADEPTWDMDVRSYETEDRVAHYVDMFSGSARDRIAARLDSGSRYEPMIRATMKAGGLPEDMYYLALVESGFDNNAYSRAAAVGMWQFMTSTARDMGMRVDWWVDERRDPVKSTAAAVRFLRGMRDQFGSLYLAAAAYNGGPGRVARGLAMYADDLENTQGEDAFFVLADKDYLKNETREYVPQLIAAALVAKEPARYGLTLHPQPAFTYDSVEVPPSTPVAAIAKACHGSVATVRSLNPQLLRGMTPPKVAYRVRIPAGSAAGFDSSLAALSKDDRAATHTIESKKGETVAQLAERYGITSGSLTGFNPSLRRLRPSGRLVPGQAILIPTRAVAAAALTVPDPSIERYGSSARAARTHTVRRGETVGGIALRYGTTTARIMHLNGMKKAMIFPGQSLIVSGNSRPTASAKKGKAGAGSKAVARQKAKKGR